MTVIPDAAFAVVLLLASLFAILVAQRARAFARDYLRFAAALYAALACADLIALFQPQISTSFLANAVTLLVSALAPVALALAAASAFARRPHTALAILFLVLGFACGLVAALTNTALLGFVPLFAAVCVMLALAARAWRTGRRPVLHAVLGALALLLGAAAYMAGSSSGRTALALFSAAGLTGLSLALARALRPLVEQEVVQSLRPNFVTRFH